MKAIQGEEFATSCLHQLPAQQALWVLLYQEERGRSAILSRVEKKQEASESIEKTIAIQPRHIHISESYYVSFIN